MVQTKVQSKIQYFGVFAAAALGGAFLSATPAQALTLTLTGAGGNVVYNNTVSYFDPGNIADDPFSTIIFDFNNVTLLDPSGNRATFSGRVTAASGLQILSNQTGSGFPGAYISVSNFSIAAATTNTSAFQLSNFLNVSHQFLDPFTGVPFTTTAATQYYVTGNVSATTLTNPPANVPTTVQANNALTTFFNATNGTGTQSLPATVPYTVGVTGQTQVPVQVGTAVGSTTGNVSYSNPSLQTVLSSIILSPGATFTSINTICNAISPNPAFLGQFGQYNACPAGKVKPPVTVSTPEASTVGGLLGLVVLGALTRLRRKVVVQ